MKKINVNQEACIGCGACVAIDSKHFAFNDEGLSEAINQENLNDNDLLNAIDSCPVSAISIEDSEDNSEEVKNDNCTCKDCDCNECDCDDCGCEDCDCKKED